MEIALKRPVIAKHPHPFLRARKPLFSLQQPFLCLLGLTPNLKLYLNPVELFHFFLLNSKAYFYQHTHEGEIHFFVSLNPECIDQIPFPLHQNALHYKSLLL
ncbi:hypothetical protein PHSC3_000856 [Chlamydiales bacterium STE3]|nr:hypothetical protein PHSC3_000856 [Chlamydiales bacterium STE3]